MFSPLRSSAPLRIALTLLLALAAAGLCLALRTPLPWMIGPLLATAVLSMLGGPAESWTPLRNIGQWIIGGALGLYFTPQVVGLVAGLWWAVALNIVWALALGLLFGEWLYRVHHGPDPCAALGRPEQAQPPRGAATYAKRRAWGSCTCAALGCPEQAQPPPGAAQHTKWQAWGSCTCAALGRPEQAQPPRGAAQHTKWQAWGSRFHVAGLSRITTYFAAPIGAASEMTLMGERHGAQTDLVASAHSLRVLLVTLIIPFGFQWAGLRGLDMSAPGLREVYCPQLAVLALLTGLGAWAMVLLKRTNPWFIGALVVSLLLTAFDIKLSALPQAMTNAAQLLIGISLGVRFTSGFVHLAPRWLASVALATVGMIVLCAGFAWALAQFTHLHWATLLLGTSPGGIAEMSITAKVLQLGVPVVTAFHVTRLAAVLLLAEPLYRWCYRRDHG